MTGLRVGQPSTPLLPSQNLTTSLLALIVSLLQSQPLNRALFHQRQGNLIRINSTQKDDGLVASVFNTQSVGPKEKRTEIVEFVKDEGVAILFLTETWM